jgi:3-oxoadipate enol-lactonase
MAADVRAVIAHAAFDRYHLVGHSMGGAIAQELALAGESRLASLTLHDTGFAHPRVRDEALARYNAARNRIALEQGMPALAAMAARLPRAPFMPEERAAEERERLSRMSVDAFIGIGAGIEAWPGARDRLPHLRVPTLVVCGELDAPFLRAAHRMGQLIPDVTVHIIPQAGHSPQYERPDLFNAALRAHLERHHIAP